MGADYNWDFATILFNWDVLALGLVNAVRLAVVCLVSGLFMGLFVGAARYSRNRFANWPATVFVEVFRNTPALVQIMWFFFAFPILVPINIDAFTAAALALSLNTAAFSAEIFRAGIQSISPTQWDGGRALGMGYSQVMRRIILPQAVRRMIPAFTNRGIELAKMTTLASTIAYGELLHQGRTISVVHYNPIEAYTAVALIFFVTIYPATQSLYWLERRLKRRD